jgi:hypothetical protein
MLNRLLEVVWICFRRNDYWVVGKKRNEKNPTAS